MARQLLGLLPVVVDFSGYVASGGESDRVQLTHPAVAVDTAAAVQVCLQGGAALSGAVCTVRLYDVDDAGNIRATVDLTLDDHGGAAVGLSAVAYDAGLWVSLESDTNGDYSAVITIQSLALGA